MHMQQSVRGDAQAREQQKKHLTSMCQVCKKQVSRRQREAQVPFVQEKKRSIASLLMCLSEQAATSTKTAKDLEKRTCNS